MSRRVNIEEKVILAGDIGGTKTHLALFDRKEKRKAAFSKKFKSKEHASVEELIEQFLSEHPHVALEAICLGIAGPIQNGVCQATNLPWIIDSKALSQKMEVKSVFLINDLEANAYGINSLEEEEFFYLNPGRPVKGNAALISAGTGLGEAGLFWDGKKYHPFACEGGHCSFSPESDLEIELLRYLRKQYDHVSFERVLSGPGLKNLYQFLIDKGFEKEKEEVKKAFETQNPPQVITEMAMKKTCSACMRAVDLFVTIYGNEAANLALKMLSVGGVYLGGGIAPKILNNLLQGDFMTRFIQKGRFTSLLLGIPVKVILNENAALLGAAYYAEENNSHC